MAIPIDVDGGRWEAPPLTEEQEERYHQRLEEDARRYAEVHPNRSGDGFWNDLGVGLERNIGKVREALVSSFWRRPMDRLIPISSESADSSEAPKKGLIIEMRGQTFSVERDPEDGTIAVNGNRWRFAGTTPKTRVATITLRDVAWDPDQETFHIDILGRLFLMEQKVSKSLKGDAAFQVLQALASSSGPLSTPEMSSQGIQLERSDV